MPSTNNELGESLGIYKESYEQYLDRLKLIPPEKYQWVYDILDGFSERKNIIYQDDTFILVPDYTWDKKNMAKIHLLAIPRDKSKKSLRSLTGGDVGMLEHLLAKSLEQIESRYQIQSNQLRSYIHYPPSAWQLHIHFNLIDSSVRASSVGNSYNLDQVISNLKRCSDYYQRIWEGIPIISKRILLGAAASPPDKEQCCRESTGFYLPPHLQRTLIRS